MSEINREEKLGVAISAERTSGAFRFASKLERHIARKAGEAIGEFNMIEEGDQVLVAVSGGKDSLALARILSKLRERSPVHFSFTVVTIDQGNPAFDTTSLIKHYQSSGYDYRVEKVPITEILQEKLAPGTMPCGLCSRIRRGALYTLAKQMGCQKIALGHHLDDLIETLLMNFFYGGQLRSMSPYRRSDDEQNTIIRPFCFVPEAWLADYANEQKFPVTTCATAGCAGADSTRARIKKLVKDMSVDHPQLRWQALKALRNVRLGDLLDARYLPARQTLGND